MKVLMGLLVFLQLQFAFSQSRFNDDSLNSLLTNSEAGIIFSWSPLMPLSHLALKEIIEISDELNLDLEILIDTYPSIQFEHTDVLLESSVLIEKGMLNHFPSTVLYKNESLLPWMIQGYEDKEELKKLIRTQLEKQ